jgi:hypothetical protein
MLIHGIASSINNGWHSPKSDEELENFLRKTNQALHDGLRAQFEAEK